MAEENPQPQNTGEQPSQVPPQQAGQQPKTPQGQTSSGQRRNDRRDHSRHHRGRRDQPRRDQHPSRPGAPEQSTGPTENVQDSDDEEETGQDRTSPQGRHHYRGGRPPKKIIEEWANDPYCE